MGYFRWRASVVQARLQRWDKLADSWVTPVIKQYKVITAMKNGSLWGIFIGLPVWRGTRFQRRDRLAHRWAHLSVNNTK